jgi:hypothetical protein
MTTTSHHIRTEDLSAYIDGMVTDRERTAIANHLAACRECRAELVELQATVRLLNALPQFTPRRSFQLGMEHDTRRPRQSTIVRLLPVVRSLSVAAMILFIVASGALFLANTSDDDGDSTASGSSVMSETGAAGGASQGADEAGTTTDQSAPANPAGDGRLTDRGAAASSGEDPLEDLTNLQEAQEDAPDQASRDVVQVSDERTSGTSLQNRLGSEYGSAFVIGLGILTLVLVALWIVLVRMRQRIRVSN